MSVAALCGYGSHVTSKWINKDELRRERGKNYKRNKRNSLDLCQPELPRRECIKRSLYPLRRGIQVMNDEEMRRREVG